MKFPAIVSLILLAVLLSTSGSYAQKRQTKQKLKNLEKYDHQRIHFGFLLGVNNANFIVKPNPDIKDLDSVYVVEAKGESGFTLGIVSNLMLGRYFDLRFIPSLSFSRRKLEYTLVSENRPPITRVKTIESTFLEFPLQVKFKSVRLTNGRAFVVGGFRYSIDLASQKDVEKEDEEIVKLKRSDYAYEIGFGIDIYLRYFKLSPVIMLSLGMNNMLVKEEGNLFSESIDRLYSKIFQFGLTFQ